MMYYLTMKNVVSADTNCTKDESWKQWRQPPTKDNITGSHLYEIPGLANLET